LIERHLRAPCGGREGSVRRWPTLRRGGSVASSQEREEGGRSES
jgi:hypothetical protein